MTSNTIDIEEREDFGADLTVQRSRRCRSWICFEHLSITAYLAAGHWKALHRHLRRTAPSQAAMSKVLTDWLVSRMDKGELEIIKRRGTGAKA